ncbi:MAG: 7-carboxy-7-deazaguanine synthase QueE [Candidatus Syntropharchaeales archaeon]
MRLKCLMVSREIHEIFTSFQGEGSLLGRRQIFIRFRGCSLNCFYCDTKNARTKDLMASPTDVEEVIRRIESLITPDLHSISFTGGEPLESCDLLMELASRCKTLGLACYLETAGVDADAFKKVVDLFDYAAIDVKLQNHRAVSTHEAWSRLYQEELVCIRIAATSGLYTIVKIVIPEDTAPRMIADVCHDISEYAIDLILQPLTGGKAPSIELLLELSAVAGAYLKNRVMVIPQVHRLYRDGFGSRFM